MGKVIKFKGNDAYKNKNFTVAIEHYSKAMELDPKNITYITNRAGKNFLRNFCVNTKNIKKNPKNY